MTSQNNHKGNRMGNCKNNHMDNRKNILLHKHHLNNPKSHMERLLPRHDRQLMVRQPSLEGHLLSRDGNLVLGGHLV